MLSSGIPNGANTAGRPAAEVSLADQHLDAGNVLSAPGPGHSRSTAYHAANDGACPLRLDGQPLRIIRVAPTSMCFKTPSPQVIPFIRHATTAEERARLYQDNLQLVRLPPAPDATAGTAAPTLALRSLRDLHRSPAAQYSDRRAVARAYCERKLAGQDTVVARRFLPNGTCLGVYSGEFLHGDVAALPDFATFDPYLMRAAPDVASEHFIIGNGILSRINSIFEYEEACFSQAASGYNVSFDFFAIDTDHPQFARLHLPVVTTIADIECGEELRIDYGYSPAEVAMAIGTLREQVSYQASQRLQRAGGGAR